MVWVKGPVERRRGQDEGPPQLRPDGETLRYGVISGRVRVRDGKRIVTDGPYAETREVLGGFYLIDVDDLDQAIEIAARHPGVRVGTVEIRPVFELSGLPKT